jgi:type VI secretion system protein ImpK
MPQAGSTAFFGVLHKFQEFYIEVMELKRAAGLRRNLVGAPGAVEKLPEEGFAAETRRKTAAILERQYLDTLHVGRIAAGLYREARFVMAAFADEVFVRLDWDGSGYWLSHLLETQYFRTQSAGEVFFANITSLLANSDPAEDELRILYLTALALGFRGKYADAPDSETIVFRLRKDLYERITLRTPHLPGEDDHLFPEAYLSTATGGVVRRMPSPLHWWGLAAGAVVMWLLFSTVIWHNLSDEIRTVLDYRTEKAR